MPERADPPGCGRLVGPVVRAVRARRQVTRKSLKVGVTIMVRDRIGTHGPWQVLVVYPRGEGDGEDMQISVKDTRTGLVTKGLTVRPRDAWEVKS